MNLKVSWFRLDEMGEELDFNWAKVSFSDQMGADGSDFIFEVQVRVPKSITDLQAIKAYALDRIRKFDLTGL